MIGQLPTPASLLQHEWPPVNKGSEPQLKPGVCLSNEWKKNSFILKGTEPLLFRPVIGYCRLSCLFSVLRKSVASVWRQGWSIWITVSLWCGDIHYSSLKYDVALFILTDRTVRRSSVDICVRGCTFFEMWRRSLHSDRPDSQAQFCRYLCPRVYCLIMSLSENFVLWKQYKGK